MDVDVIIIGAGIVGLACARESAKRGFSTFLVERHDSFGQETSSRNSEVIHSGIYYTPGSLKARLCLSGNRTMYADCEQLGAWCKRCGKLIVAVSPEEEPELEELYQRGITNGVEQLSILDSRQVERLEPNIRCRKAIYLPSTGIVDSHELMRNYSREAKEHGADTIYGFELVGAERIQAGYKLIIKGRTGELERITSRYVINSGGLHSDRVAQLFGIDVEAAGYRLHPNRGHYYRVGASKARLVSRLVYPVPHPQLVGVGIHITIDKAGQCRLGPDTGSLDPQTPESEWYTFDDSDARRKKFHSAAACYFPLLELEDLSPDQIGIRPKIQKEGEPAKDFVIREERDRGLPGLIDLIGIESPGLTCASEIAKEVFRQIADLT